MLGRKEVGRRGSHFSKREAVKKPLPRLEAD